MKTTYESLTRSMTKAEIAKVIELSGGLELMPGVPFVEAGKSYDGRVGVLISGMFYGDPIVALEKIVEWRNHLAILALGPVQGPLEAPEPFNACDGEEDGEALYFSEMGFTADDIRAYRERHEKNEAYEPAPMACGHVFHEEGGPSDYPAKCRRAAGGR
jgi:hypothetical protein